MPKGEKKNTKNIIDNQGKEFGECSRCPIQDDQPSVHVYLLFNQNHLSVISTCTYETLMGPKENDVFLKNGTCK